jgi:hypothetical protein
VTLDSFAPKIPAMPRTFGGIPTSLVGKSPVDCAGDSQIRTIISSGRTIAVPKVGHPKCTGIGCHEVARQRSPGQGGPVGIRPRHLALSARRRPGYGAPARAFPPKNKTINTPTPWPGPPRSGGPGHARWRVSPPRPRAAGNARKTRVAFALGYVV